MEHSVAANPSAVAPGVDSGPERTAQIKSPAPAADAECGSNGGYQSAAAIRNTSPIDPTVLADSEGLIEALLARLSDEARESFTKDQRLALAAAAQKLNWGRHPVDIRLSLPSLFDRYYLVVIGGRERRDRQRRQVEARRHRVNTWRNWIFVLAAIGLAFYAFSILGAFILPWYWKEMILQ